MSIKRTIITTIVALALVAVVAPAVNAQTPSVAQLMQEIAALQAQLTGLSGTTTTSTGTGACAGVTFTRNLTTGATGSDVKCLQTLLNQSASTQVATTGAGSPGAETSFFGPATLRAVKKYQAANGLTPAAQVGPMTRQLLNAALSTVVLNPVNPVNPVSPVGSVSAMVASDNPASGAIISNQATADLLHINFTGSGTVTSVTLQRTGISDQNTLQNVYLFDGNQRITDGYSFNINGTLTMNGLSIPVNGSHEISVRADVESGATSTSSSIALALTGFNGGSSNVQGNTFTIVTGSAAAVYLTSTNSTCSVGNSGSTDTCTGGETTSVNAGTSQYDFWSAQLQVNTRAVLLKTANFRMIGSAPTNALSNINLFVDGVNTGKVATVGTINGTSYAMFDLTSAPITLTTGTHTLDVRANITSGTSRTLQLSLQQASDLTVTDPQVGVNIALAASSSAGFTANPGIYVTIAAGSSTVMVDPTFTSQTNISGGATNAVIGRFTLQGYGENVKVSDLYVTPELDTVLDYNVAGTLNTCHTDSSGAWLAGTCGLNNVTLYFNGSQIGSQKNWTLTTSGSNAPLDFSLGSQMIIPAGQTSTVEIRADLQNASSYNYTTGTVKVSLVGESSNATGQSSQTSVGVPTGTVSTSGLSISSSTVVAGTNPQLLASSVSPNTASQRIGSYIIQNQSTSESVRLTSLNVGLLSQSGSSSVVGASNVATGQLTNGTAVALTNYAALTLKFSDSTPAPSPVQPNASNNFSINDTLAPGASVTVDVYANVGSPTAAQLAAKTYAQTTLTVQSIGSVDNISATYPTQTTTTYPEQIAGQVMQVSTGSLTGPSTALNSSSQTTPQSFVVPQGSTTSAATATFEFTSANGTSVINELDFAANSTVTQICVGTACATPFAGTAKLTGLSLPVTTGGVLDQVVNVAFGPIGANGGSVPNTASNIELTRVKYTAGGAAQSDLTPNAYAPYTSQNWYLVNSMPTVTVSGTATGLSAGGSVQKIGDVIVKADTHGGIKVDRMVFNVGVSGFDNTSTSIGQTSMFLVAGSGSTANTSLTCTGGMVAGTGSTIACAAPTTGSGPTQYGLDYSIGQGSQQEFSLWASIQGSTTTAGANPTVTTSLVKDSSPTYSAGTNDFVWDDISMNNTGSDGSTHTFGASGTTTANGTGLTSAYIYSFPITNYQYSQH